MRQSCIADLLPITSFRDNQFVSEDSSIGWPVTLLVPRIPVGGVVGVVGGVVVVTLTLPVDVVWPAPGVVEPVAPAVAGEVVAGAPAVL